MECKPMMRTFEAALREIASFGRRNPGYGFSCASIAQDALNEAAAAQRIEARSDEIPQEARPEGQEPVPKGAPCPECSGGWQEWPNRVCGTCGGTGYAPK